MSDAKINSLYQTPSPSYSEKLNSDNKELIKISLLVLGIAASVLGVVVLGFDSKVLHLTITQFLIGEGLSIGGMGMMGLAYLVPKIVSHIEQWKLKNFLLKNYVLVDTNLDTKDRDLDHLLDNTQVFLLTERHNSEEIQIKNKQAIEKLWDDESILLSEIEVDSEKDFSQALEFYKLEPEKVRNVACWDVKSPEFDILFRKQIIAIEWVKRLLEYEISDQIIYSEIEKQFEKDKKEFPGLSQLEEDLKAFLDRKTKESHLSLMIKGLNLIRALSKEGPALCRVTFEKRQASLVQHVVHYAKEKKVFLIAGRNHLAKKIGENWQVEPFVGTELKSSKIPYVVLHPKDKEDKDNFWQNLVKHDNKIEVGGFNLIPLPPPDDVEVPSSPRFHELFASQEQFLEEKEKILQVQRSDLVSASHVTDYMRKALLVLACQIEILKSTS